MLELSGFQRDLLIVINSLDEPHGLGIKNILEDYYEDEINHGRLYPNLDTLVEEGHVLKSSHDKRTNGYMITKTGRSAVRDHHEWETRKIEQADGEAVEVADTEVEAEAEADADADTDADADADSQTIEGEC